MGSLAISPDGRRPASIAERSDGYCVVPDGREQNAYDGIGQGSLIFSPDSRHVAYWARSRGRGCGVVDGVESPSYDGFLRESRIRFASPASLTIPGMRGGEVLRLEIPIRP